MSTESRYYREEALRMAVQLVVGLKGEISPAEIVEVAELFYKFLTKTDE